MDTHVSHEHRGNRVEDFRLVTGTSTRKLARAEAHDNPFPSIVLREEDQ